MNLNSLFNQTLPGARTRTAAARSFWKIFALVVFLAALVVVTVAGVSIARNIFRPQNQRVFAQTQPPRPRPPRLDEFQMAPPSGRPAAQRATTTTKREKPTGPQAAAPEFSVNGGVFTNSVSVSLKAKSSAAVIRYTQDGSEPSSNSPTYVIPIKIANTTLIRAKSFEPGLAPSDVASQTYTMLDASLVPFSSNLPLVVLDTFGQYINTESYAPVSARFINLSGQRSTLLGPADFDGRGELKRRGYSSLRFAKPSYTFKIREDGEKKKASIYGMPADSDWVLYAPYSDKTMMRDVLAYELSNKMGRWAARTKFVEVFVSRLGGKLTMRDYLGVYVFEEKIARGKERVNIAKLGPEDNSEPNISGGYIFKRDHSGPPGEYRRSRNQSSFRGENGFLTSRGLQLFFVEPEEQELTPQQKQWLTRYVSEFERALYGQNFKSPTEGYAKYLDVDSFIDQFWIVEMSKNIDAFRYSAFMYKDRGGKIKMEPLWDWNLSFGNANYHDGWETEEWYYPLIRDSEICWVRRLLQDPDFEQKHIDRWGQLRKEIFAPDRLRKRVDEMAAQLNEAQDRNYQRWPILGRSVNPNWFVGRTFAEEVNWMKNWMTQRIAWIDRQFVAAPALSEKEGPVRAGTKLTMRASSGKIYYTVDGSDPRVSGGGISKQARVYESPMPIEQTANVFARVKQGNRWSPPSTAKLTLGAGGQ